MNVSRGAPGPDREEVVDAVLTASRALVAIAARSLAGNRRAFLSAVINGLYINNINALFNPAFIRLKGRNTGSSIPATTSRGRPV